MKIGLNELTEQLLFPKCQKAVFIGLLTRFLTFDGPIKDFLCEPALCTLKQEASTQVNLYSRVNRITKERS